MKNYLEEAGNIHLSYYLEAADILGIKYEVLTHRLLAQFSTQDKHWFILNTVTPLSNTPSKTIASRKNLTNMILKNFEIPVPFQKELRSEQDALAFYNEYKNIVIKPKQSLGGKGISILPQNEDEIKQGYKDAFSKDLSGLSSKVLGEEYIIGDNYRLLTLRNKVVGVVRRLSATVYGDGGSSIETLITNENQKRQEQLLMPIPIDNETIKVLSKFGYSLSDIPPKNEKVKVRLNTNLTTGGITEECSAEMHPFYEELAIKALNALDLQMGGIDLITPDISKPCKCAINEINYNPGLRLHYKVNKGEIIKVAVPIMEYIKDRYLNS